MPPAAEQPSGSVRVPDADPGPGPSSTDSDFIHEAPGVSLRGLSRGQKDVFFSLVNTESSACDRGHSLAQSLRDDSDCYDSTVIAQFIADAIEAGASTEDIRHDVPVVTTALQPKRIEIGGRPVYGPVHAPVTIVVFADFECPHCRIEASKLQDVVNRANGKARLVFKHFPLSFHPLAKRAAIAAEIAHRDDKFWAMHDRIFSNQHQLTEPMLLDFAAKIGMDAAKFKAAYDADAAIDLVEADVDEGKRLGIAGTPTVYVDGRQVNQVLFGGSLEGWLDDALRRHSAPQRKR